ncbi:MAG: tetratricopeptide repeat protein [Alphaproteobacteria bacterium]|nr:tetratricopeptide repeat protein [Alphaproteobacteria bacterium]
MKSEVDASIELARPGTEHDMIETASQEYLRQATAALERSDVRSAITISQQALDAGFNHPLFLNLRAYWFEGQGRHEDALRDLEQAAGIAPNDVPVLNALGLALGRADRMQEAQAVFDRVVELAPGFPPGHFNKGWASERVGRRDVAAESYRLAIALQPGMAPPYAHLAALMALQSNWIEVRKFGEQALRLDPRQTTATIAITRADIAEKQFEGAIKRLNELLESEHAQPEDCATAHILLGDIYDRISEFRKAYEQYTAGNNLQRMLQKARFAGPGKRTMPIYLDELIDYFTQNPNWFSAKRETPAGHNATEHLFVLGFPRSGTTLLEEILATLPNVSTTQEQDGLIAGVREYMSDANGLNRLRMAKEDELEPFRDAYWERLEQHGIRRAGNIVVDKHPNHTAKLPLIVRLFPTARIIFCLRDPRDVVWGCFRQRFEENPTNFEFLSLEGAARMYDKTMCLASLYFAMLPLSVHWSKHENLVEHFEEESQAICDFVGRKWDERMRHFAEHARSRFIITPSGAQISAGLSREGIGRWRNYRPYMESVLPILEPWVKRYGYSPS